jgi:hypothetical protein
MRALLGDPTSPETPHLHAWQPHAEGALREIRGGVRLKAGRLRVHAWWSDIAQAEILTCDEAAGRFVVIDEAEADHILARLEGQ